MARLPDHIFITGASGSGTTTLGSAIADRHGHRHLDTDDYLWEPSDPPYTTLRAPIDRIRLMEAELDGVETGDGAAARESGSASQCGDPTRAPNRWVITGSLDGWGDVLIPRFDLVVWLLVPEEVRIARLQTRERADFGARIDPGGDMHEIYEAFIEYSRKYEHAGMEMRSRARHDAWTSRLPCPVARTHGDTSPGLVLAAVERFWQHQ